MKRPFNFHLSADASLLDAAPAGTSYILRDNEPTRRRGCYDFKKVDTQNESRSPIQTTDDTQTANK